MFIVPSNRATHPLRCSYNNNDCLENLAPITQLRDLYFFILTERFELDNIATFIIV